MVDTISNHFGIPSDGGRFVDAFCGTGAVAEVAAENQIDGTVRVISQCLFQPGTGSVKVHHIGIDISF